MSRFKFRTNTEELKKWLNKRRATLEDIRRPYEGLWKDLRLFYEPTIGKALLEGDPQEIASRRDDDNILNSTPRLLMHRMSAGLQSGITNQSRRWFSLTPSNIALKKQASVRKWCDESADVVAEALNRSNAYSALDSIYLHLAQFGTSAAIIYKDNKAPLHIRVIDCGAFWLGQDTRGRVDTLIERITMTLSQLVEEFGEGWLSQTIRERIKDGRGEEHKTVWHIIQPNTRQDIIKDISPDREFISIYWIDDKDVADGNDGILAMRSFSYNPIIAPRWSTNTSVYGIGCGQFGLGDAKQLQQLESDKLRLVELEVDPPMAAPSSMRDKPINTGASGITYYDSMFAGGSPVTRLYETRQDINSLLEAIASTEARIRQTFYADLFALMINLNMQPKVMTAREVNELASEKVALLGPILTRLNTDLLNPLVDATFTICVEAGLLPDAPQVFQGENINVEYISSLHVEQASASRIGNLYRLAEFVGSLAQFDKKVIDKIDMDAMVSIAAVSMTESGVVRDDDEVAKIREAEMQVQMQAQMMEAQARQVQAGARAAKELSQADLGSGQNALQALLAGGGTQDIPMNTAIEDTGVEPQ